MHQFKRVKLIFKPLRHWLHSKFDWQAMLLYLPLETLWIPLILIPIILKYSFLTIKLSVKLLKEGTKTPKFGQNKGQNPKLGAKKIQRGWTGYQTWFWTKSRGQTILVPNLCPLMQFFVPRNFTCVGCFHFFHFQ
jgi:hypothetical protein